ncbi:glycosyltransferase N-terminal domain-containing protein [Croceitalea sp. MTPC5]|nr:glycosyltransferase N-terminal domain-containing protein [Croceitalea sp. MTPC5]
MIQVSVKKCILAQRLFLLIIYNILTHIAWFYLKLIALFNPKMKLFVRGRQRTFSILETHLERNQKTIWMHAASLGEYEQGLPLLERLKQTYTNHNLVLSFFSPSGYEVKKNKTPADVVVYLPMDSAGNAKRFVDLVKPDLAIFIKYEIWPNYLHELNKGKVPTLLVSAIFSKRQVYFKPFGSFMRKSLKNISHFFVQDENSKTLLNSIGFSNTTVSGDTRFDRVSKILEADNRLDIMDDFVNNEFCLVVGSSWPEDEAVITPYINEAPNTIKFVIAPHNIKTNHIQKLETSIKKKVVRYSSKNVSSLKEAHVLIVDTIGLLTKIYSYANVAYVGGGFATGLHNTLEPAVFGIPVIIGPKYSGFKEAEDLIMKKGILSIETNEEFKKTLDYFFTDPKALRQVGSINHNYIKSKLGATELVLNYINSLI